MTRRLFFLAVASGPVLSFHPQTSGGSESLLKVHDLRDFAVRFTSRYSHFRPERILVRLHPDFWPGAGSPRRWEAWLEDASGHCAMRVLADPAYAPMGYGNASPRAMALAMRLRENWMNA